MFTNSTLFPDEKQTKFRKDCLKFYVAAVQHLQSKLPLDIPFVKHAQFLHPKKCHLPGATSAVSNHALSIYSGDKTCLQDIFLTRPPVTREEVCDMVRNQWLVYQNEIVQEECYKNLGESSQSPCSSKSQNTYWKEGESEFGLESQNLLKYYKRIDHYRGQISYLRNDKGGLKCPQLLALVKCVLSVSHGNSTLEHGFSINKMMLETHGYTIYKDTIVALRIVKGDINRVGSVTKFNIDKELIKEVKLSCSKYEVDWKARKAWIKAQEAERNKKKKDLTRQGKATKAKELLDAEIVKCKSSPKVADDIIEDAKGNLQKALSKKDVDRELTQQPLSKVEIGTERKRKFENDLDILEKKKKNAGMKTFFISLSLVFIFLIYEDS